MLSMIALDLISKIIFLIFGPAYAIFYHATRKVCIPLVVIDIGLGLILWKLSTIPHNFRSTIVITMITLWLICVRVAWERKVKTRFEKKEVKLKSYGDYWIVIKKIVVLVASSLVDVFLSPYDKWRNRVNEWLILRQRGYDDA